MTSLRCARLAPVLLVLSLLVLAPVRAVAGGGGVYRAMTPVRAMDTRQCAPCGAPIGPYSTPFAPGTIRTLNLAGISDGYGVTIPATGEVTAVVLNVTASDTTSSGYLTLFPDATSRPNASNVNFEVGQTVANLVQVAVAGTMATIDIYNFQGSTDVIIDVAGYFTSSSTATGLFNSVSPARYMDTRQCGPCGAPIGPYGTPFGAGQVRNLLIAGASIGGGVPVPAGAAGVILNVTVTDTGSSGFLTIYAADAARPNASNLNFVAGQTIANRVYVKLSLGGEIDIYNFGGWADVIVDVDGYFSDGKVITSGDQYYPLVPARIIDTRQCVPCGAPIGPFGAPLGGGQFYTIQVAGSGGVPSTAGAAHAMAANVTATDTSQGSYFTLWPNDGSVRPNASDLNWRPGVTAANLTVTKLSSGGSLDVYNYFGSVDLIIDIAGYYGP